MRRNILTLFDNFITFNNFLGDYIDYIDTIIDDDSPPMKTALMEFLLPGIRKTYINTLKIFCFEIVELCCRLTEDPFDEVRELAIKCVGILKARLGNNFSEKSKDLLK
jgi:hypothetical protein